MRKMVLPAITLAMVAFTSPLRAQLSCSDSDGSAATCTVNGTVSVDVPYIVYLEADVLAVDLTDPDDADFTSSGTADLDDLTAHTFTVRANADWTLSVTGAAWTAPGTYVKPIADLSVSSDGTTFTALSTSAVTIETGSATDGEDVDVSYRTTWSLASDIPGAYSMALAFTIAAP